MAKFKGVCFDLDQTLCNSEDFILSLSTKKNTDHSKTAEWQVYQFLKPHMKIVTWERFLEVYKLSKKEVKKLIPHRAASHSRYLYIQRTLENFNMRFQPNLVYEANNIYWDFVIRNMELFPGVLDVLKAIKQNHIKICVLTDLTADIQIRKMQKINIERYVDYMVTSEEAGRDKPSTRQLTLALKKMNLKKEDVVMIGNNPKTDIQLAKEGDIKSILFDFNSKYNKQERNSPNLYTSNFKDILGFLKINNKFISQEKLVVFDMIGTITTDPHLISSILCNLLPESKYEDVKRQYERFKVGKITNEQFWNRIGVEDKEVIEKKMLNSIRVRKGAMEVIKELKGKYKLAILSNIPKEWGWALAEKHEFKKYFDAIVFSGDYKIKKPHPEIYKLLLKKFPDINPNNIFFIDDSLKDLQSGKNLLMQTIWLKREQDVINYIPDYVVNRIGDVKDILP